MKQRSAKPLASSGKKFTDDELKAKAQLVANAFTRAFNKKHLISIPVPVPIEYDLHTTEPATAGMAYQSLRLKLNIIMLRDYPEEFLNRTIPHECAHLAEYELDKKAKRPTSKDHGWVWASMMQSMSQPVLKYHGMSTKKSVAAYKAHKRAIKLTQKEAL
jgi:predicted SprT family Zn-dependent metalloprotease